jgi:hypothetical protein
MASSDVEKQVFSPQSWEGSLEVKANCASIHVSQKV